MSEEAKKPNKQEEIRKLKTWIPAKEVVLREVQRAIETQGLYDKQLKEDVDSGFLIKQKKKEIAEQMTDGARKLKELELDMLELELENKFLLRQSTIIMEDLEVKKLMEENAIKDIQKKIKLIERNHHVEVKEEKKDE